MSNERLTTMDDDANLTLNSEDFDYVSRMVLERSAIVLEPHKAYLVEARLVPLARRLGLENISALVAKLRTVSRFDPLVKATVEAMTTNETSFFRDLHPFTALKEKVIPDLIEARKSERQLNFWCAASSSGQEPYTVCMLLRENFPELATWNINFIATDISTEILRRAEEGFYSQLEVNRGLPVQLLVKYFEKTESEWNIKQEIRDMITFQQLNLIETWPSMPPLDICFIRNVLIYFDIETKRQILEGIRKRLRPDGYLFLGTAETTLNIDPNFERKTHDKATYYTLKQNG